MLLHETQDKLQVLAYIGILYGKTYTIPIGAVLDGLCFTFSTKFTAGDIIV